MPTCPYGASVQAGAPAYAWFGPTWLSSVATSALKAWLLPLILALDNQLISTATLCAVDQPDPGAFPTSDLLLWLATGTFGAPSSAARLSTWLTTWGRAYMWSQYCQCNGTGSGTCPGSPYSASPRSQAGGGAFIFNQLPIPAGATTLHHAISNVLTADAAGTKWTIWFGTSGSPYSNRFSDIQGLLNGQSNSNNSVIPAGYTLWSFSAADQNGNVAYPWGGDITVSLTGCSVGPSTLPAPTEPARPSGLPDAPTVTVASCTDLSGPMEQLLQELTDLQGQVRYLIGQQSPYAYTLGTPSSGLSGTGYVAVTECLGVLVTLTTIPGTKGAQVGTPTRHFDVGRINWGDVNGYHAHHPIHESPELILGIPDTATRIGYTFPVGVVATITPVKRA